ncbi:hypothetical protein [Mesorhizobium sp. M0870]|uniref:hypothetical protein n=1 Tax=Mesorhizobium sp. M0870 TaxID=2957016 RepID=UPI003338D16F
MDGNSPTFRRARIVRRDEAWLMVEGELLRKHWPDIQLLRKHLPHRSELAIRHMAKRCGLIADKIQHIWTMAQDSKLRRFAAEGRDRKTIAQELGLTVAQVANRLLYKKINIAKMPPVPTGDHLVDAIKRRAFDLRISTIDLDRSLGNRRVFRNASKRKSVAPARIHQAVRALGGRLVIEWADE